jgi:hypothetical protein
VKPWEIRKRDSKERTLTQMEQAVLQYESARRAAEPGSLGSTVWYHLPCTNGFAPSDFDHVPRLKENLTGQFYTSDDEVKRAVESRIGHQNSQFSTDGLMTLIEICRNRVDRKGDYVEK